jgi:uncharacterized protein YcbK (DUF882 family)
MSGGNLLDGKNWTKSRRWHDFATIRRQGRREGPEIGDGRLLNRRYSFAPPLTGFCGFGRRGAALVAASLGFLALGASQTQNAVANGDTRTISLYHTHTSENITVTYRRDGVYDRSALAKLNHFLRDWRNDDVISMDPRLFDVIWETYREVGSSATIKVVSAYRSPGTNAMLRRRSSGVAKHSQHTMGKAMDLHLPDVNMSRVREIGMRLQKGGVGYYPTAGTPFVHLDVGSVRSWPRMTRPQLERLFPDGKTVHLPADGTPLPGYQLALAEIEQRGGAAMSYADVTSPRRSLWAALFGGGEDDEAEAAPRGRGGRAVAARGGARQAQQVAAINPNAASNSDAGSVYAINNTVLAAEPVAPTVTRANPRVRAPEVRAPEPKVEPEASRPATAVAALSTPARKAEEDEGPRRVAVPAPIRRPTDQVFAQLAAATIPLPPVRPKFEAESDQKPETAVVAALAAADAAREPQPKPANVPLPQPRPVAFAAAPDTVTGAVDRSALPAAILSGLPANAPPPTMAFAAARVPLPPPRPSAAAPAAPAPVAAAPQAEVAPGKFSFALDTSAMNALMAGIAAEQDKPRRTEKVAAPGVRQTHGSVIVAGRFGASLAEAGKFSGGLVRPLGAGFVRQGE